MFQDISEVIELKALKKSEPLAKYFARFYFSSILLNRHLTRKIIASFNLNWKDTSKSSKTNGKIIISADIYIDEEDKQLKIIFYKDIAIGKYQCNLYLTLSNSNIYLGKKVVEVLTKKYKFSVKYNREFNHLVKPSTKERLNKIPYVNYEHMVLETIERDEELNSTTIFLNYTISK